MQTWLYLLAAALLGAYCLLWVRQRRARALLGHLPTLTQLPFIGSLHWFYGGGECIFQRLDQMSKISDEKMQPFVVWFGPELVFLLCHDPDDVRTISNTFIEKPYYYSFGNIWLGDGLLTAPVSIWKQSVKKLSGVFSTRVVEGYQGVFNAQSRRLVDDLREKAGAPPFDVMTNLALTTLEAICQTALGVTSITDSVETEKYYIAFTRTLELLIARGFNLLAHPDCLFKLTAVHRELVKQVEVLHIVSDTVLKKKKAERENAKKNEPHHPESKDVKFLPVLDLLLDIGESDPTFSEQQIKSEVDTIIVGGQETIATTLYYTLLMIGCKPTVQDKLYTEMRSIFGDTTRPVEKQDLSRMVYCEAVLNETLRLYPPAPMVMRYADKEVKLKSCTVPKGTCCALNIWGAGRSKRSWGPDALEYRPERWLDGDIPTSAAFLAFSYGRRACIGKRYALVILKTILAYCVRELEFFSEADKMQFKVDVTLRPVSGHLMQIKLRNK